MKGLSPPTGAAARPAKDDDEAPPDPDAQTTVTDFLDFTEYLPSDMMRSLTLIGKLDETYIDRSKRVHELTSQWGQLPSLPATDRPSPVQLRADISEQLNQAVNSRIYAHAEAIRMSESVDRHYNKAKVLLAKLQTMMDNYPKEEEQLKSPVAARSPQATRQKAIQERKPPKIPKITVPGEVLAPYDIEYDFFSDGSDESSDEDEIPATVRRTPGPTPRIKIVTSRPPKSASRPSRNGPHLPAPTAEQLAAHAAALLKPPPPDAVIGSADAPWLQLTDYELAKLRKRMKKNATWTPSETMVARELRLLGRGPEEFKQAKQKAEEEGTAFEPSLPKSADEDASKMPTGAVKPETDPSNNRGMKLNEAKKSKREALAKQAAEEAEASVRKMAATAKLFLSRGNQGSASPSETPKELNGRSGSRSNPKRKRDDEETSEGPETGETPSSRPQVKRTKTETPVPPPQYGKMAPQAKPPVTEAKTPASSGPATRAKKTETPVPLPIPLQSNTSQGLKSPTPSQASAGAIGPPPPRVETPVPLPRDSRRKSSTPIVPPPREMPTRESARRETRGDAAKRTQTESTEDQTTREQPVRRSTSRVPENSMTESSRRPSSRSQAPSQEPQPSTTERPRRTSTARNTPAPEARPPSRRSKRPAPGIVSTTSSGGSAAVGKRKAAPRRKARTTKRKGEVAVEEMEEVDDEGNPIDPDEARYCLCNRVSFGRMIACDNVDVSLSDNPYVSAKHNPHDKSTMKPSPPTPSSKTPTKKKVSSEAPKCASAGKAKGNTPLTKNQGCKNEWFHLECVGLEDIPARTTKWYCPECRRLLNIGEKGEVNARGVRK